MKVIKEKKEKNIVTLEIEEDYGKIASAMDIVFKDLSRSAKIPGFRAGKVPRSIFEKHYGKGVLMEKAVTQVMNDVYPDLIKEKNLDPIDYPSDIQVLKIEENQPFVFSLSVPVKPEVKLGKYKGIKISKEASNVTDEEFNKYIDDIRDKYATFEVVEDKPAAKDMIVSYSIQASSNGEEIPEWTKDESGTKIGAAAISEDFDNNLIGMKTGETKSFPVSFPEDYRFSNVAGKDVEFTVTLKEIREKQTPELDNELVKRISEQETVDEYKKTLRKNMEEQKKNEAENKMKEELIEKIIEDIKVDVPDIMIEKEIDTMLRRFDMSLRQSGLTLDTYLKYTGKDAASLRNDYREVATKKVKADLTIEEVAKQEDITVTDEDVENEYVKLSESYKTDVSEVKSKLGNDYTDYMKSYLKYDKTVKFLIDNAKIK